MNADELRRFEAKYTVGDAGHDTPCWLWTGAVDKGSGYARFRMHSNTRLGHRVAYVHYVGPVQEGLELDHLCRVRRCVNPAHLEPVTHSVNLMRGAGPGIVRARSAAVTHCPKGHAYSPDNTYLDRNGCRMCRECGRQSCRSRRLARAGLPMDTPNRGNAAKTHCKHGHLFDAENTYTHRGKRYCRACLRANSTRYARRRAA